MDENGRLSEQMPQTIGRYQVLDSVGYGAMGAVYKAFDPLIKRTLAIKTIRLDIPRQSPQYRSFIDRFYHEARISGTLSHPNIVTLFDIGEEGGLPYLAMEFVEGETISSIVERGERFPPEKVIALVSQIASAVDYAHSKGVIHRDIKPSNLILYEGERVKVTDFGIAKLVDAEMTQSGTLLGTPSYMSPEQAMGDRLDGRSDIFSLGVCAFEMLSGEQPFPGTNVTSILYKLVHVDPIEPANLEMNGLVPQKWHEVFSRVLAKKPDDRYQTANDFVQDLEYCLGSWFGAAVDDEPLSEVGGAAVRAAAAGSRPRSPGGPRPASPAPPPAAAAAEEAPASRPGLDDSPADALSALVDGPGAESGIPPTIQMKPGPPPPFTGEKTVSPAKTVTPVEATVLMKSAPSPPVAARARPKPPAVPAPAPAPKADEEAPATVVLASPQTVRAKAPEVTLRTSAPPAIRQPAPAAPAARMAPPSPPPTGPSTATVPLPLEMDPTAAAPTVASPVPGARRSGTTLLVVGGVALALVLGLGLGGLALVKRRSATVAPLPPTLPPTTVAAAVPTAAPTVAPPPAVLGAVRVESQPAGATVTVDNQPRGVTPLEVPDLALGHHDVKVELKGYTPATQAVELVTETPRAELKLTLARVAPAPGVADILSTPLGATVKVDGAVVGRTPLIDFKLKPGPHHVEVSRDGYETWSQTAAAGGRKLFLDANLRQVARATPPPTAAPEAVDVSRVYAENEVDTPPKKLSGMSASYPSGRAPRLKAGDAVSVTLNYVVNETGQIADLKVTESGGKVVDEEVLSALKDWRYAPGSKRGTNVKVRLVRKFTFKGG
jgi:serine/threonine-protein kinase